MFSSGTLRAQGEKEKLVIISPHWEGIRKEYEAAFREWYKAKYGKDVEIEWLAMGTSDCLKYIEDQFSKHPESIGIDIFWGGGVDPYMKLASEGLLYPFKDIPEEILGKIPKDIGGIPVYDEECRWFGTALSGFGVIYNKKVLEAEKLAEPNTWEDLAKPEYLGWIMSADPRHSGSTHMCYEIMLQAYGWERGWEIIVLLGANVKKFTQHSSEVPEAVAAGEAACGLAIDFYAWSAIAKYGIERIGYVMPEGLTVINPDSIAILKGAPHLDIAKEFVKFVLSKEGQKLWMLKAGDPEGPKEYTLGRMCVIPELYDELSERSIVPLNPFEIKNVIKYNTTKGSIRWVLINDLIGATIIDVHEDLVKAWKSLISAQKELEKMGIKSDKIDQAYKELITPFISEEEALTLSKKWSDQSFRNTMISKWHEEAIRRYNKIASLANEAVEEARTRAMYQFWGRVVGGIVAIAVIIIAIVIVVRRRRASRP